MLDFFLIVRWGFIIIAVPVAAYWGVFLFRLRRAVRSAPSVRAGLNVPEPESGWPHVTVIVPAHNEENVIERCARGLLAQRYEHLAVVFVLDRCTDATRERLEGVIGSDDRVTIIENATTPGDWAGKCYAAGIGADRALHDPASMLIFTDADTHFAPDLVRAAVGLALDRGVDLLSLLSTLESRHWFERIVQPVASLGLMRMFPIDRVNRKGSSRNFANGQFMLFRREMYDRIGGHETVRDDLLEDIAFARHVRKRGGRGGVFFDDGMLRCAMYRSFAAFREGWERIFIEACKRRAPRLRRYAGRMLVEAWSGPMAHLGIVVCAIVLLASGPLDGPEWRWLAVAAVVFGMGETLKLTALRSVYRRTGVSGGYALFYPLGVLAVAGIMLKGARDLEAGRPVHWGGRHYILGPRVSGDPSSATDIIPADLNSDGEERVHQRG